MCPAGRRAERPAVRIETAKSIPRNIPDFERLSPEVPDIIETNAETVLAGIRARHLRANYRPPTLDPDIAAALDQYVAAQKGVGAGCLHIAASTSETGRMARKSCASPVMAISTSR